MALAWSSEDSVLQWLLNSDEPAIRRLARQEIVGEHSAEDVFAGAKVQALSDFDRNVHPYRKWMGAHWRLVSLVELGIPRHETRAVLAFETVLDWLADEERLASIPTIAGFVRAHASQEGNALAVGSRLGLTDDPRVHLLATLLIEWQWPDGGWNCDPKASGRRSSFHESLIPMWGLHEYAIACGNQDAEAAARRASELFLEHRLFRSTHTNDVIHPEWLTLHYPPYWHYDILQALLVLARMGLATDARASEALDVLERRRLKDGRWRPGAYWWAPPGNATSNVEVVDWGRGDPNEMITLNSLRVLKAAGRLDLRPGR